MEGFLERTRRISFEIALGSPSQLELYAKKPSGFKLTRTPYKYRGLHGALSFAG